jgi:NAD+ synthase
MFDKPERMRKLLTALNQNGETTSSSLVRPRFLVGLSGGIDSTAATYLAVKAVGIDSVLPVTMPHRPDDESVPLAAVVREALGFCEVGAPYVVDIRAAVDAHRAAMEALASPQARLGRSYEEQSIEQKIRSGNFASRVRTAVLSDLQRAVRGRILGTVNRTEVCQGYGTKFGTPYAYDIGLWDEVYKIDLYEMGRVLGVPQIVLDTPPSTGFFAGQTHAGELGATIEEQDVFAYLLFEKQLSAEEAAQKHGASLAFSRIMEERFLLSEHKRQVNREQEHLKVARSPLRT